MSEYQYFEYDDFQCQCGCDRNEMSRGIITQLDAMRDILGFPIIVSSGYRCLRHPIEVAKVGGGGPHTTGLAADVALSHLRGYRFTELAFQRGFFKGYGFSQKGRIRFIHIDTCKAQIGRPRPHLWSY